MIVSLDGTTSSSNKGTSLVQQTSCWRTDVHPPTFLSLIISNTLERSHLLLGASYERSLLDSLCSFDELKRPSVSAQTVLLLSEKIAPSYILGVGGILFELFFLRISNRKTHDAFVKLVKQKDEKKFTILQNQNFKSAILSTFTLPFWFHVINVSASINRKRNQALAQWTLMLEYRGLSRFGIEILSACKVATHPRTHDRIRNNRLLIYDNENKRIISEGKAVIAIDNYSHFYGSATISLNRSNQLLLANNTVGGLSVLRTLLNLDFVYTRAGNVLPSVPSERVVLATYITQFKDNLCTVLQVPTIKHQSLTCIGKFPA